MSSYSYNDENLTELRKSFSDSRLSKYLALAGNNSYSDALVLYHLNCRLSGAFLQPLQVCEVVYRNAINDVMISKFGQGWLVSNKVKLVHWQRHEVDKAALVANKKWFDVLLHFQMHQYSFDFRRRWPAKKKVVVVSDLNLGFWVQFFGKHYDATLWRTAIHEILSTEIMPKGRKEVQKALDSIRIFRNRIAHHEQNIDKDPELVLKNLIEVIGWVNSEAAKWVKSHEEVSAVLDELNNLKSERGWTGF